MSGVLTSDTTRKRKQSSVTYRRRWRSWRRAAKQRDTILQTWVAAPRSLSINTPRSRTTVTGRTSVPATDSGQLGSWVSLRAVEHRITSVLSALSWRRFEHIQPEMLSTHCVTTVDSEEVSVYGRQDPYSWLSLGRVGAATIHVLRHSTPDQQCRWWRVSVQGPRPLWVVAHHRWHHWRQNVYRRSGRAVCDQRGMNETTTVPTCRHRRWAAVSSAEFHGLRCQTSQRYRVRQTQQWRHGRQHEEDPRERRWWQLRVTSLEARVRCR